MPDPFGFDHLYGVGVARRPPTVACIDCPERGALIDWPEGRRKRHARSHGKAREQAAARAKSERELILAGETLDG